VGVDPLWDVIRDDLRFRSLNVDRHPGRTPPRPGEELWAVETAIMESMLTRLSWFT